MDTTYTWYDEYKKTSFKQLCSLLAEVFHRSFSTTSLQERKIFAQWWVLLIEGLVGIAAGVLTFFWPAITALVLLYVIAFWAIVTGIFEIVAAFWGRLHFAYEWTLALAGILSVVLGVLLIIRPGAGLLSLVWLIGVYALAFGVLLIIRAFQFRTAATTKTQEESIS